MPNMGASGSAPDASDRLVVCSVTSAGRLHRAKVMARSVKKFEPEAIVFVCLAEESFPPSAESSCVDRWVLAKDLGIPDFYSNMLKYRCSEAIASVKAAALQHAMKQYPQCSQFVYLDDDTKVYYRLEAAKEALRQHPIWLTPHILNTSRHQDGLQRFGLFNSGFIAIARSKPAEEFLKWWNGKLSENSYKDERRYAGQGWLDFAPLYFDAKTLRHPGYNMGMWNIGETGRDVTHTEKGIYYLYEKPLVVFHYAGIDTELFASTMREAYPEGANLLYRLAEEYRRELAEEGGQEASSVPWSYDLLKAES